ARLAQLARARDQLRVQRGRVRLPRIWLPPLALGGGQPRGRNSDRRAADRDPAARCAGSDSMSDSAMASSPAAHGLCPLPVLYVDDERENLSLFELQFGSRFKIRTASSGSEALAFLAHEDFGVLLTDERMPGMTGIDLLSKVVDR